MSYKPLHLQKGSVHIDKARFFHTPQEACAALKSLYETSCQAIQNAYAKVLAGDLTVHQPEHACYPYVGFEVMAADLDTDARYAYGVVDAPGFYGTTISHPHFFEDYLLEQLTLLSERYGKPFVVGYSRWAIPLPFVVDYSAGSLNTAQLKALQLQFVMPDLRRIDDHIVNHTLKVEPEDPKPLALFSGERIDFSLQRLSHYTGTSFEHFQNFILLTNYERYVKAFIQHGHDMVKTHHEHATFVEPGDVMVTHKGAQGQAPTSLPQMPAYHLKAPGRNGITLINIGVGPSNARNITDHLAVLRPHCWVMLGHCAGLKRSQQLGDYVLAHGYVREDAVLDDDLPLWVPIPALAEVQLALQEAVTHITGLAGQETKKRMRTGTVFTTHNRNWELRAFDLFERFNQSRAIALDMESATIAANGLRMRVPYGTLLCVSDKPIHGEIKLKGMANNFYKERIEQHLLIGLQSMRILHQRGAESLHSRKLRGFDEPPFR